MEADRHARGGYPDLMGLQWSLSDDADTRQRKLTVDEVYAMVEAGIIGEEERLELIDGVLVEMSPKNIRHERFKNLIAEAFVRVLEPPFKAWVATTVRLSHHSYVEPDITIFRYDPQMEKVTGAECELVIEIANTSLRHDQVVKVPKYAEYRLREYWLVNTQAETVTVHRRSDGNRWAEASSYALGSTLHPLFAPDLAVNIADIVGPPDTSEERT